jgi:fructose-specific phosphotransferase system IIA component
MDSSLIALDVKARSRNEAIRHLVRLAAKSAAVRDPERFLREVLAREKLGTTAVGEGVAFPHARSEAVSQIVVAVGRLKNSVDFGAEDGKRVRLVVLMGTPPKDIARYLKLLARFAALMRQQALRERLLRATSAPEVLRAIDQADSAAEEE